MADYHGIIVSEADTSVQSIAQADSALPFVVGLAPIYTTSTWAETFNKPILIRSLAEFKEKLGWFEAPADTKNPLGLCEFASVYFGLYGCREAIFVPVGFDPTDSTSAYTQTIDAATGEPLPVNSGEVLKTSTIVVKNDDNSVTYVAGVDYSLAWANGALVLNIIDSGSIDPGDELNITGQKYTFAPSNNDYTSGLDKIEEVFEATGRVPSLILCPNASHQAAVAAGMQTKARSFGDGRYRALALVDVTVEGGGAVTTAPGLLAWKQTSGLNTSSVAICWPAVRSAAGVNNLSSHLAALTCVTDYENSGIPFVSPSNKPSRIIGATVNQSGDWTDFVVRSADAREANSYGVVSVQRRLDGFVAFGNATAAYPSSRDPKERFVSVRRMFNFVTNTLQTSFFPRLDDPMTRRNILSITEGVNQWLGSLVNSSALLTGRIEFLRSDNTNQDLIDGKVKFRLFLSPPSPLETIEFVLEYDPQGVETLFEEG